MTQSVDQIRSDIEQTKENITSTVEELGDRLQEMKDWHTVVDRYPLLCVGATFLLGTLLAGGPKSPLIRHSSTYLGHTIKAGLTGVVLTKVTEVLKKQLA